MFTDIHCHILPGLDDGSGSFEESLDMARLAVRGMTDTIVCTPHSNVPFSYRNYWTPHMDELVSQLAANLSRNKIPVRVYAGQEVFLDGDLDILLKEKKIITVNHSRYMLVEAEPTERSASVYRKLESLISLGITPVLAHPERYRFVGEDPDAPGRLHALGCILQCNKGSFTGAFGRTIARTAFRMLEERQIDCIASDAHSPNVRTPFMRDVHEMICEDFSYDYADYLMADTPRRIIENQRITSFRL